MSDLQPKGPAGFERATGAGADAKQALRKKLSRAMDRIAKDLGLGEVEDV